MAFAGYRYHQRIADDEWYSELTGQALQATGGIHGVTNHGEGQSLLAADVSDDSRPVIDADADRQRGLAVPLAFSVPDAERFQHAVGAGQCLGGTALRTTGRVHDGRTILYRASKLDCDRCPLKARCCPKVTWRKVPRNVNEAARDIARALMKTPQYQRSRDERKRVEMRFAHLKTHHRFERMRLRGLSGARDEFHLVAVVQNLKTLAKNIWPPPLRRPAPAIA